MSLPFRDRRRSLVCDVMPFADIAVGEGCFSYEGLVLEFHV
jgi:hypothetical protein